jgi:hypothetical protein
MIAILAVAVVGLMLALVTIAVGVYRMANPVDGGPAVTRFAPSPDPETDRLAK